MFICRIKIHNSDYKWHDTADIEKKQYALKDIIHKLLGYIFILQEDACSHSNTTESVKAHRYPAYDLNSDVCLAEREHISESIREQMGENI